MKSNACSRCGLQTRGGITHPTADDCLMYLAPRYKLASDSLTAMHRRYRTLEERLERMSIQQKAMRQETARARTVNGRLDRLEFTLSRLKEK